MTSKNIEIYFIKNYFDIYIGLIKKVIKNKMIDIRQLFVINICIIKKNSFR